jgi:hypothetical protein
VKRFFVASVFALLSVSASAEDYRVAVGSYNLFEFPSPVREAILPDDIKLADKPRYVDGNKGVLLKFEHQDDVFQMVVTLADGATHMVDVVTDKGIGGQRYRIGDFSSKVNRKALSHGRNPNADFLGVMAEKLADLTSPPKGFVRAENRPSPRLFRGKSDSGEIIGIALDPVERLVGTVEGRKVYMDLYLMKVSGQVSHKDVDPSQFAEKGVGAVTITRDGKERPYVLIVRNAG